MSDRTNTVKSYVPLNLRNVEPLKSIYKANGLEAGSVFDKIQEILNNLYVPSAAGWGLALWEEFVAIPTNLSKTNIERRSEIIAKLRGFGTVTKELIKNVALAYTNGEIDVIEDNPNYKITIEFLSVVGIPDNFAGFQNIMNEIVPAHIVVEYAIVYNTYDSLKPFTYEYLNSYTNTELRESEIT